MYEYATVDLDFTLTSRGNPLANASEVWVTVERADGSTMADLTLSGGGVENRGAGAYRATFQLGSSGHYRAKVRATSAQGHEVRESIRFYAEPL